MKQILILGAGLVSQPAIEYFLKRQYSVTVADLDITKAEAAIDGHPRGTPEELDLQDHERLSAMIASHDITASLVPYSFHPLVAKLCIEHGKPMVNASYVSEEMQGLHQAAQDKDVLILCETGLDPGIDHMSAMQIIDRIQAQGGTVQSFNSYCGGLPAPAANNNPFGYKFSWSPKGVLLAGLNDAQYLKGGHEVSVAADDLFDYRWPISVQDQLQLEAYPNRNSISYIDTYGLQGIQQMLRGTLRYPGWCEALQMLKKLSMLSSHPLTISQPASPLALTAEASGQDAESLGAFIIEHSSETTLSALQWLGILDEKPRHFDSLQPIDILASLMEEKMQYGESEKDMIAMIHQFETELNGERCRIESTMLQYGSEDESAMAKTVALPLAIAMDLILQDKITHTGIQIPIHRDIYEPILTMLAEHGITLTESSEKLSS